MVKVSRYQNNTILLCGTENECEKVDMAQREERNRKEMIAKRNIDVSILQCKETQIYTDLSVLFNEKRIATPSRLVNTIEHNTTAY